MNVLIWNEHWLETPAAENMLKTYPEGMHGALKAGLGKDKSMNIKTATFSDPDFGLSEKTLSGTDVILWWGHAMNNVVPDTVADRVVEFVNRGGGIIFLHSAHGSKPFRRLMGTTCTLKWREASDSEIIWTVNPAHPIAAGVPEHFLIDCEEMYGEPFDIPEPDELVFIGWFSGGEVFRSGACYKRGYGKIFYFQPGHETYPVYMNENVVKILSNAVKWAAPAVRRENMGCPFTEPHFDLKK